MSEQFSGCGPAQEAAYKDEIARLRAELHEAHRANGAAVKQREELATELAREQRDNAAHVELLRAELQRSAEALAKANAVSTRVRHVKGAFRRCGYRHAYGECQLGATFDDGRCALHTEVSLRGRALRVKERRKAAADEQARLVSIRRIAVEALRVERRTRDMTVADHDEVRAECRELWRLCREHRWPEGKP